MYKATNPDAFNSKGRKIKVTLEISMDEERGPWNKSQDFVAWAMNNCYVQTVQVEDPKQEKLVAVVEQLITPASQTLMVIDHKGVVETKVPYSIVNALANISAQGSVGCIFNKTGVIITSPITTPESRAA